MEISKIGGHHTCVGVNKCLNTQANSHWIAQTILGEVKANPNITPKEIINTIQNKYQMKLPYHMAWSGREKARESIFGNVDKSYDYAESLRLELLRRNPGSHVDMMVDTDMSFLRFFVCFKACIDGFRLGCRPLIGLDGCHLRSKYLGMLLSAVALDGNNGLFPIAFAVVEGESGDTWHWFVKNLQIAFQGDLSGISFISDQEKGLQESLSLLLPDNEHRVCLRHLWKTFKKNFSGDFFEQTVWDAARSYTSFEFDMHMSRLKGVSEPAWRYLKERRQMWSRSQFSCSSGCHYITNNLSESFNSWILDARSLPAVELVDKLRQKIMLKMNSRRIIGAKWKGKLVPNAARYCQDISKKLGSFEVCHTSEFEAEVEDEITRRTLNIREKTCSCNRWQLSSLPCIHAANYIGSIRNARWDHYCADYFTIERYMLAYSNPIAPLPSKDQWISIDKCYVIGPPNTRRPRGRPKKKRIQFKGEDDRSESRISKRVHKCTRC